MNYLKRYLYSEIGIEFKACLYFGVILFFYFLYRIIQGSFYANIIIMTEMIFTTYIMGYLQVYLLGNFVEAEQFGKKEGILSVVCSLIYAVISYLGKWFDRDFKVSIFFFLYAILSYLCVFLCYKIKRDAETMKLNRELDDFKRRKHEREKSGNINNEFV